MPPLKLALDFSFVVRCGLKLPIAVILFILMMGVCSLSCGTWIIPPLLGSFLCFFILFCFVFGCLMDLSSPC